MDRNNCGRLISIDLLARSEDAKKDSTDRAGGDGLLPANCEPAWIIPDQLRNHHQLRLGDSRQTASQTVCRAARDSGYLAPQVGLEPTTLRLTAECSTIELLRTNIGRLLLHHYSKPTSTCQIVPLRLLLTALGFRYLEGA
jgi:hypothetical protein